MLSCTTPAFFFFNDTATTEIYTLSLHDALPISKPAMLLRVRLWRRRSSTSVTLTGSSTVGSRKVQRTTDRKSTRLNSSHLVISYAVFCLKKKNTLSSSISSIYVFQRLGTDTLMT